MSRSWQSKYEINVGFFSRKSIEWGKKDILGKSSIKEMGKRAQSYLNRWVGKFIDVKYNLEEVITATSKESFQEGRVGHQYPIPYDQEDD